MVHFTWRYFYTESWSSLNEYISWVDTTKHTKLPVYKNIFIARMLKPVYLYLEKQALFHTWSGSLCLRWPRSLLFVYLFYRVSEIQQRSWSAYKDGLAQANLRLVCLHKSAASNKKCLPTSCTKYHLGLCSKFIYSLVSNVSGEGRP